MAPPPGKFNAAGRKRRRDPVNVDVKLVEIYEDLTNFDPEVRIKAALELVQRYTPDKNPSDEDIEKVLKRLFRGLCSGRKAARLGFATALTEILIQIFEREVSETSITVAKAIELWETQTTLVGDPAGQSDPEFASTTQSHTRNGQEFWPS
ncbi:DNA-directed DNA polymerase [Ascosphaera atra]|nr:DNA-directed DNA polymerase [Ascosphaera atra]